MNARKLYTNAYRLYREHESEQLDKFVQTGFEIGLIDNPFVEAINAASISYCYHNVEDRYKTWMEDAQNRLLARRIFKPTMLGIVPLVEGLAKLITEMDVRHD